MYFDLVVVNVRRQRAAQFQLITQSILKTSYSHKAEGCKFKVNFSQIRAASNAARFMIHELFHVKKTNNRFISLASDAELSFFIDLGQLYKVFCSPITQT